ncbi:MAG: tyrosine-type recombinase/integrase [Ktedonobacteraceae bacterium]
MTDEEKTNTEKQPTKRGKRRPRKHGSGSVFRRPERKGKQWVAQIMLENGISRQRYFNTEKEADEALNEMLYEQRQGTLVTERDQTVQQLVEHWIENVKKKAVRLSTYTEYRKLIRNHILPGLGHFKLRHLTMGRVEAFYTRKQEEGLSVSYIRLIHAVLHQALSYAVKRNLVARNVCEGVTLPRHTRHEIQPLTPEQAQKLLAVAKGHRLEAVVTTAVVTGMREGELLALHWSDINFEQGYLQIRRTVRRFTGQGMREGEPKTASSRRRIDLSPYLLEVLKHHRVSQLEARLKAGKAWEDHDLVFCNRLGKFFETGDLGKMFHTLLQDAGLPRLRFHDLRHSAATMLLAMGVNVKVVQELLGHSTVTMTLNIYGHVLPGQQQAAIEKMSDLFDQGSERGTDEKPAP